MRSDEGRRAWLAGWLSCWDMTAKELLSAEKLLTPAMEGLVQSFRNQLEELSEEEKG